METEAEAIQSSPRFFLVPSSFGLSSIIPDDPGNDAHGGCGHKTDTDQPQLSFGCTLCSSLSIFQFPQKSVHVFEKDLARYGE
jgi:hypothetical protein